MVPPARRQFAGTTTMMQWASWRSTYSSCNIKNIIVRKGLLYCTPKGVIVASTGHFQHERDSKLKIGVIRRGPQVPRSNRIFCEKTFALKNRMIQPRYNLPGTTAQISWRQANSPIITVFWQWQTDLHTRCNKNCEEKFTPCRNESCSHN